MLLTIAGLLVVVLVTVWVVTGTCEPTSSLAGWLSSVTTWGDERTVILVTARSALTTACTWLGVLKMKLKPPLAAAVATVPGAATIPALIRLPALVLCCRKAWTP